MAFHTIYGADGEHPTPYMTRLWIGRLRLHIFHRPDADLDCHDHPWDFWTFPLTPYVEEVAVPHGFAITKAGGEPFFTRLQVVPAFRLSFRPAEHCHRVRGRYDKAAHDQKRQTSFYAISADELSEPPFNPARKIVTIVWRGGKRRSWGFLKNRAGQWCWIGWRDYVFGGGKHAPCEPEDRANG